MARQHPFLYCSILVPTSPVVAPLSTAGDNTFSQVFFYSVRAHHMTPCVFSLPTSIFPPASPTSSLALISRYSSLVTHHEPLPPNPTHMYVHMPFRISIPIRRHRMCLTSQSGRHPLFSGNPGWQSDQGPDRASK